MIRPYSYDILDFPGVVHGFFDRYGGREPLSENTFNLACSDTEEFNLNKKKISDLFKGKMELMALKQVHGDDIVFIKEKQGFKLCSSLSKADALCTNIEDQLLLIQTADCQAVLLFDPVKRVVAAVHNGWRGSCLNILGKTIVSMCEEFNCKAHDIRALIGPSLGPCCAEFINWKKELLPEFKRFKDKDDFFDFWAISQMQLENLGVLEKHIAGSSICTSCNELWFSYRKRKDSGRLGAFIALSS